MPEPTEIVSDQPNGESVLAELINTRGRCGLCGSDGKVRWRSLRQEANAIQMRGEFYCSNKLCASSGTTNDV